MADDWNAKLNAIEQNGRARFGEANWNSTVEAIKRATAAHGGTAAEYMTAIAGSPDPAGLLMQWGRHCLMDAASSGDAESERAYTKIRQAERKAHAEYKGRGWQD